MKLSLLSVLIPCYNEAEGLARLESELFGSLESAGFPFEVIAVDDGSTDSTAEGLANLSRKREQLRVATHKRNRGLGAALRTGLAEARGDWIVALDADLTFHPDHIPALIAEARESGADCVSGSPFLSPDSRIAFARRVPSLLLNAFYRGFLDGKLTSYTPIFRLYRTLALRALPLTSNGFEISAEILALLIGEDRRIREIPVPLTIRRTGESKLGRWRELKNHLALIWRLIRPRPKP